MWPGICKGLEFWSKLSKLWVVRRTLSSMSNGKNLGFGVRPGFEGQLHSLLALCPWASYFTFLNLSLLTSKVRIFFHNCHRVTHSHCYYVLSAWGRKDSSLTSVTR